MPPIADPLPMTDEQRAALERMAGSTSLPHRKVVQAQALLLAADGVANNEIARRLSDDRRLGAALAAPVRRARASTGSGRIAPGRGRKSWLPEGTVAAVVRDTLHATPRRRLDALDDTARWPPGSGSARTPWPGSGGTTTSSRGGSRRSSCPTIPHFEEKLVDVVGLYMNPPERAVVFCFDEKTQVQALDRTQPSLPLTPGPGRHDDP